VGVAVHILAARLGYDPNTVLATYAHLLPQSDEQAAKRVAALSPVSVRLASGPQIRMVTRERYSARI
jgi:hypothetical protein